MLPLIPLSHAGTAALPKLMNGPLWRPDHMASQQSNLKSYAYFDLCCLLLTVCLFLLFVFLFAFFLNGALSSSQARGFVNYYGPQRFGSGQSVQSDRVGLALLKEDLVSAADDY